MKTATKVIQLKNFPGGWSVRTTLHSSSSQHGSLRVGEILTVLRYGKEVANGLPGYGEAAVLGYVARNGKPPHNRWREERPVQGPKYILSPGRARYIGDLKRDAAVAAELGHHWRLNAAIRDRGERRGMAWRKYEYFLRAEQRARARRQARALKTQVRLGLVEAE